MYVKRSKRTRSWQNIRSRPASRSITTFIQGVRKKKKSASPRSSYSTWRDSALIWPDDLSCVSIDVSFRERLLAATARLLNPLARRAVTILTFVSTQMSKNQLTIIWKLTELFLYINPFLKIVEMYIYHHNFMINLCG